jgi:hypothetical protein
MQHFSNSDRRVLQHAASYGFYCIHMTSKLLFRPDLIHTGKYSFDGCTATRQAQHKLNDLLHVAIRYICLLSNAHILLHFTTVVSSELLSCIKGNSTWNESLKLHILFFEHTLLVYSATAYSWVCYDFEFVYRRARNVLSFCWNTNCRLTCSRHTAYCPLLLLLFFCFFLWGWDLRHQVLRPLLAYCTAPDDRWGWLWSNWWNEDWQRKP